MAPSHSEDLFLVEIITDGTGPFACFCPAHYLPFRLSGSVAWFGPNNYRAVVLKHYLHEQPRVTALLQRTESWKCRYWATGRALAGALTLPGLRFWAQLWQHRVPRGGAGTEGSQPSRPSARAGLRVSCGLPITDIFSFSQRIPVLRCSWCHFAARLSQPPRFLQGPCAAAQRPARPQSSRASWRQLQG